MKTVPLRYLADLNPSTPEFDRFSADAQVAFLPLEAVWSDSRADHSRLATKSDVANGYTRFRAGDVVCPKVTPTFQAGRSMVTRSVGAGTTELHILRPRGGVDARWLCYAVRSKHFLDEGVTAFQGVAGLQRVPPEFVNSFRVADYDPEEQRRIADFLDDRVSRIDRIIAARREQVHGLGLAAKSELAARAFGGDEYMPLRYLIVDERLGLWGSEQGEDETEVRIARVADFLRPEFRLGDVPTVRSAPWTHVKSRLLRHGDVLLERSGGTQINPVGCPAYVESPDYNVVCSNFVSRLRPREEVNGRYLSLLLGALYSTRQQAPHSTQTTGIMNLNTTSYFSMRVPVRSLSEQSSTGAQMEVALEDARSSQAQLNRSIDLLSEYKASLITAAVTGELDVTTAGSNIPG